MTYHTFIGIDCGKTGGMAVLTPDKMTVYPVPCDPDYDIWKMHMVMKDHAKTTTFAVIERAQAMPGQGVVSMFEYGKGYGIWLALLSVNYIAFRIVHPVVWTKVMLAGAPGEGKERNLLTARRLRPTWVTRKKKDESLCDCILLAEYAKYLHSKGVGDA